MPQDNSNNTNIIAFRLDTLEEMVALNQKVILEKLQVLIDKQAARDTAIAVNAQKRQQLEVDLGKVEKRQDQMDATLTNLQITMAEKLGPGALAGGFVALGIELAKFLVGGV